MTKRQKDKQRSTKHTTQWAKDKRTNNDLQNIQHNDQKTKGQTTIYKTYNTMTKRHKDKQRSTKHTHKTKDRITETPLKTGGKIISKL